MSDFERARSLFGEGLALYGQGHYADAETRFREANRLAPGRVSVLGNLSAVLLRQDKVSEAREFALEAIRIEPDNPEACLNLGVCMEKEGELEQALQCFRKAAALRPDSAEAWSNCGHVLNALKQPEQALASYDRALALKPDFADAWTNRGSTLNEMGRSAEALENHDRALALQPAHAEAWYNRGNVLAQLKRHDEAIECHEQALKLRPDFVDAHINKAVSLLSICRFQPGWEEYEWRWASPGFPSTRPVTTAPTWDGRRVEGTLWVWSEQGIGDEILYCSMLDSLRPLARRIMVTTDRRLLDMLRRSFPGIDFRDSRSVVPPGLADFQVAMGSLGKHVRRTIGDFPSACTGFLKADPQRAALFRARISHPGTRTCGIAWASKNVKFGPLKSLRLADLLPVLTTPGLRFVDLQYGDTAEERTALAQAHGVTVQHLDELDCFNDIEGLAALIDACDCVVTSSNVTVHLAGALGKPAHLITPVSRGKIWYWHENQPRSLWYPSVRMHWQALDRSWSGAIADISRELGQARPPGPG